MAELNSQSLEGSQPGGPPCDPVVPAILEKDWAKACFEIDNSPFGIAFTQAFHMQDGPQTRSPLLQTPQFKQRLLEWCQLIYLTQGGNASFNTLDQAIVRVGFETVRHGALTIQLCDYLMNSPAREQLMAQFAESLLAMHIFASIMPHKINKALNAQPFMFGLLLENMSEFMFAKMTDKLANTYYEARVKTPQKDWPNLQKKQLSFTFSQLTREMVAHYQMSDAIVFPPLGDVSHRDVERFIVSHAKQIAAELHHGFNDTNLRPYLIKLAEVTGTNRMQVRSMVYQGIDAAIKFTSQWTQGSELQNYLPRIVVKDDEFRYCDVSCPVAFESQVVLDNSLLEHFQSRLADKDFLPLQTVLEKSCQHMQSGLHFDRVVIALLSSDKKSLHGKFYAEVRETEFKGQFNFALDKHEGRLLKAILKETRPNLVGASGDQTLQGLRTSKIDKLSYGKDFVTYPLVMNNKIIGIYYADRALSEHRIDVASFEAFIALAQTTNDMVDSARRNQVTG